MSRRKDYDMTWWQIAAVSLVGPLVLIVGAPLLAWLIVTAIHVVSP